MKERDCRERDCRIKLLLCPFRKHPGTPADHQGADSSAVPLGSFLRLKLGLTTTSDAPGLPCLTQKTQTHDAHPVTPAPERLRQEDPEWEGSLGYIIKTLS